MAYGKPGVGKTSLAAKFENVLIAGFEMGSNALNNVYVQPAKTWSDWKSMVSQLTKKKELKEKYPESKGYTVESEKPLRDENGNIVYGYDEHTNSDGTITLQNTNVLYLKLYNILFLIQ